MRLPRDIEGVRLLAEKLARKHAAVGGKVVGYVTPCVPAELISAAGLYPIMLSAGQETSSMLGDRVMENLFDASVRGIFERLLKGEFDHLSAIVLPRANDSAHRLYYYLCELKRLGEAKLPPVLLCDVVTTPDSASRKYSVDALGRLWGQLRALADSKAGDAELRAEIAMSNARTAALEKAIATRTQASRKVMPAPDALALFAAVRMLPDDVFHHMALEQVASSSDGWRPEGPRIIICGSAHHDSGLHETVEAAGGLVVGDYHASGELSVSQAIDLASKASPLETLADRGRCDLAASRRFVEAGPHIAAFAKAHAADAAIFSYLPEEEALTWDYPEQKEALEVQGVRVLRIEQSRPFDLAASLDSINGFVRGAGA